MEDLHFPIALSKQTDKLIDIQEAANGLACNCYCFCCKGDMVAVNDLKNKHRAYFRHHTKTNCLANMETYIHWLTKEVFKTINSIWLPPINSFDLYNFNQIENKNLTDKLTALLKRHNLFDEIQKFEIIDRIDYVLSEKLEVKFEQVLIESPFNSKYGNVQVDIVLLIEGHKLFIEPFFLNPINDNKLQKIKDINISTLAIKLMDFISPLREDWNFTKEELADFLVNDILSKRWTFIKRDKIQTLINKFVGGISEKPIEDLKALIKNNNEIDRKIKENADKMNKLSIENEKLKQNRKKVSILNLLKGHSD